MAVSDRNRKKTDVILVVFAGILSAAGVGGFLFLFVRDFNVYGLILAPVVLAVYQIPAVFVFWLWKRRRRGRAGDAADREGRGR